MKALSPMPVGQDLNKLLDFCDKKPSLISGEYPTHMRPVDVKRFIHNLREYRQFIYASDFVS
jgi:hypothetical protein